MLGLLKCTTSRTIKMPRQRYRHRWICNLPGRPAVAPPPPPTAHPPGKPRETSSPASKHKGLKGSWVLITGLCPLNIISHCITRRETRAKKVMRSVCEARYVRREAESLLFPDVWLCCDKGPIIWSVFASLTCTISIALWKLSDTKSRINQAFWEFLKFISFPL